MTKFRFQKGNKYAAGRNMEKHHNWKGGRYITKAGYVRLSLGHDVRRLEHVVVMEEHLGRRLRRDECVHHINGNKQDNRIENLELMTKGRHQSIHSKERWLTRPSWLKDKPLSAEHRKKISDSTLGKKKSPEHTEKLRLRKHDPRTGKFI